MKHIPLLSLLLAPFISQAIAIDEERLQYSLQDYIAALESQAESYRSQLEELTHAPAARETEADLLDLETSRIRKLLSLAENKLHDPQASYLHACDSLVESISILAPYQDNPYIQDLIQSLETGQINQLSPILAKLQIHQPEKTSLISQAHYQAGDVARDLDHLTIAYHHFEQAATLSPSNRAYLELAADLASSNGYYAQSIKWTEDALLAPESPQSQRSESELLEILGANRTNLDHFSFALSYYQLALESARLEFGEHSIPYAYKLQSLGNLYRRLGEYEQALQLHERSHLIFQDLAEPDSINFARSQQNLGEVYLKCGKFAEAQDLLEASSETLLNHYQNQPRETFRIRHNLATLYIEQARYPQAIETLEKLLSEQTQHLGADHPELSNTYNLLAISDSKSANFEYARYYHELQIENIKNNFGETHSDLATTYANYAILLSDYGNNQQAYNLRKAAFDITLRIFGPDNFNMGNRNSGVGASLLKVGRYQEALEFNQNAVDLTLKYAGRHHPDLGIYQNNLAENYTYLGDHESALKYYQLAYQSKRSTYGDSHPLVASASSAIARSLDTLGRSLEAFPLHQQAVDISKETLGPDHPQTAVFINGLGRSNFMRGHHEEAKANFEYALKIGLAHFGYTHQKVIMYRTNLANALSSLGSYHEAKEQLLLLSSNLTPANASPKDRAHILQSIGSTCVKLKEYKEAIHYFNKAKEIYSTFMAPEHTTFLALEYNTADALLADYKTEAAFDILSPTYLRSVAAIGPDHPLTCIIRSGIAIIHVQRGNPERAIELLEESLKSELASLGPDHPRITTRRNMIAAIKEQITP